MVFFPCFTSTATSSSLIWQALYAASAACWLRSAYASASFRAIPCCSASFSAVSAIGNPQYVSVSPAINESSSTPPPSFNPVRAPRITNVAPPAQSPQSPTRTAGSLSPPASRFSTRPSIPHAAPHRGHLRSSASHSQKLRDQFLRGLRPNAESPLSKHAPPSQSRSPLKTPRYTAPLACAPPPQSLHPSET